MPNNDYAATGAATPYVDAEGMVDMLNYLSEAEHSGYALHLQSIMERLAQVEQELDRPKQVNDSIIGESLVDSRAKYEGFKMRLESRHSRAIRFIELEMSKVRKQQADEAAMHEKALHAAGLARRGGAVSAMPDSQFEKRFNSIDTAEPPLPSFNRYIPPRDNAPLNTGRVVSLEELALLHGKPGDHPIGLSVDGKKGWYRVEDGPQGLNLTPVDLP